ncbi:MAG TPA: hypothetical protein PK400_06840 [Phycisphaerales bacterium]|nr:hypothetical protein [Phycisphaerales bacterium]HRQ75038.1 hypothetical protein [Phycisphaerales bacterium]
MHQRAVSFILLVALLATGFGLPQYVHAMVFHAVPADAETSVSVCTSHCCAHQKSSERNDEEPDAPHPDDCNTCQFLATAAALQPALISICSLGSPAPDVTVSFVSRMVGCMAPVRSAPRAPPVF